MSLWSAVAACTVLAAAGAVPALAAAGWRWVALPLAPLAGAIVSALAAWMTVAVGGPLLAWFGTGAALVTGSVVVLWWVRPATRPAGVTPRRHPGARRLWGVGAVGFVAVVASCAMFARGLATPTVGFDARALWIMRAGWFLQPHHQLLVDLRLRDLALVQTAYPPLVSSSVSVAWGVTGQHTVRLGVVVVSVLDLCALAAAALGVVECGRQMAVRLSRQDPPVRQDQRPSRAHPGPRWSPGWRRRCCWSRCRPG